MTLGESILAGDRLALARLLTQIENDSSSGRRILSELFSHTGNAHLIGVTGAPGTGKSSLVNQLARYYRHPANEEPAKKVAIVAVDPSSPFTGGALLGDRVRMRDLAGDPGIFIRSMASRGSLGGLATTTAGIVQALDAAGFEAILIETVGAGQAEVDIARLAHTTLVIESPGFGDDIQAIKAGILEIADILVVNKADLPGAEKTERALRGMLHLAHPVSKVFHTRGHAVTKETNQPVETDLWIPPIRRTVSTEGTGIPELAVQIERHRQYLLKTGEWNRRERDRLENELENLVQKRLVDRWRSQTPDQRYQETLTDMLERRISPYEAAHLLLDEAAHLLLDDDVHQISDGGKTT